MNKREFIAELWQQVETLCRGLNIKCSKCLDTKKLWTIVKENETNHIIECCSCCVDRTPILITKDEDFYGYIGEKQILLFEDKDDTPSSRLEILKEVEKEIQQREITRMTDLLMKRDREFADGSNIERFGRNEIKEFSRTLRYNRLQMEANDFLKHIVEIHGYSWKKKYDIPIVFTWPDTYTRGNSWGIIEDENMYPIYFIMVLQAQNYMNWLKIIDSCSLFSDEVHAHIKTYILYPKNNPALDTCHRIVADIPRNQALLDKLIHIKGM
jgi:hypothetical protein